MAWRTVIAQCRTPHRPATPRATDANKTWGESGRPGSEALPEGSRDDGLRIGHTTRASSDAAARRKSAPHLCRPPPRAWGKSGRPGSKALPAEDRENDFRHGQAERASSDAARQSNAASRILRAAGPERDARATLCGMVHKEITTSRATAPRDDAGDGYKEDAGQERPAGQRGVAGGASCQSFVKTSSGRVS